MGWSASELVCKKHQNQNKNLQGVCPFCLGERLSQLTATSRNKTTIGAPSSPSSSVSASPASNKMSPNRLRHHRNVSEVMASVSLTLSGGTYGLKKSRSIALVTKSFVGDNTKNGKKKKGFWSKLLHLEGKKEILTHSRTMSMRERFD